MTQASDLERSIFHRGLLLTGEWAGAVRVLRGMLARYDDPRRIGETALARGVVQEARAWCRAPDREAAAPAAGWQPPPGPPSQLFHAVAALPGQQREAWTLLQIEQLGEVEAARAMDCSRTALREVHFAGADSVLRPLLGDTYESAVNNLRSSVHAVEPSAALVDIRRQLRGVVLRKRIIRALMFLAFALACAALWWVMADLHRANEREIERRRLIEQQQQEYSVPMSPEEQSP